MGIAFDTKKRREFVPVKERTKPAEQQKVYVLRQLDVFDRTDLADMRSKGMGSARATVEMVRLSLAGWRNHANADGTPVEFVARADGRANDDTMRTVSDGEAAEIVADVMAWEEVSQAEAGE